MRTFLFFEWDNEIWFVDEDDLLTIYGPYLNLDYAIEGLGVLMITGYEECWYCSCPVEIYIHTQEI